MFLDGKIGDFSILTNETSPKRSRVMGENGGVAGREGVPGEVSVKSLEYRPKDGLPAGSQACLPAGRDEGLLTMA